MSCGCNQNPCACAKDHDRDRDRDGDGQCPPKPCTKCDLYRPGDSNVWVAKGDNPGDVNAVGICLLDTMTDAQVIYTLEHEEIARQDLLRVTSDKKLRRMANEVPPLPVVEETDQEQALLNRPNDPAQNPFYAIFRGQPPFAQ